MLRILIIFSLFFISNKVLASTQTQIGKVISLEGVLKREASSIEKKEAHEIITLKVGDVIFEGDILSTTKEANAIIKLGEDGAIRLGSLAKIKVTKPHKKNWLVELVQGPLLSFFKRKPSGKEEPYRVKTNSAVIGVRGTSFFVDAKENKPHYFCACMGQLKIKTKKTAELLTSKKHDLQRYFAKDGTVTQTTEALGHSQEQIDSLMALFTLQ